MARKHTQKKFFGITGTTFKVHFIRAEKRVREVVRYTLAGQQYECDFYWDWSSHPETSEFNSWEGEEVRFSSTQHDKNGRPVAGRLFGT